MQGLIGHTMLTHKECAIQWMVENMNSRSFEHASVRAKGNLDAEIVISLCEGWSPEDKQCLGRACSCASVRLVVIIQRHVHEPSRLMVVNKCAEGTLLYAHLVKMQGSNQQLHA